MTILEEKKVDEAVETDDEARIELMKDAKKKAEFKSLDATARNLILQSVSDRHIGYIREAKTAHQMMKNLSAIYERKSTSARFMLMEKLFTLQYTQDEDLQDFFNKLDSIFTELTALGGKMDEQDKICCLLVKVKNYYEAEVTAFDAVNDTLSLNFVKNKLLDAELGRRREAGRGELNQGMSDQKAFYSHCYSNDHDSMPYHSKPQRFHQKTRGSGNFSRQRGNSRRHNCNCSHNEAHSADAQTPDLGGGTEISFVAETIDYTHVSNHDQKYKFIIDSACSAHCVTEDLSADMSDIRTLQRPVQIKTANGQVMTATRQGKLIVYYEDREMCVPALIVPGIAYNLLSVKLCMEKGFDVRFSRGNAEIAYTPTNLRIKCSQVGNLYAATFDKSLRADVSSNKVFPVFKRSTGELAGHRQSKPTKCHPWRNTENHVINYRRPNLNYRWRSKIDQTRSRCPNLNYPWRKRTGPKLKKNSDANN